MLKATGSHKPQLCFDDTLLQVELCGHATLAAAHTLFSRGLVNSNVVEFVTLSGILTAKKVPDVKAANDSNSQNGEAQECSFIELDFPPVPTTDFNSDKVSLIQKALGVSSTSIVEMKITTTSKDVLVILSNLLICYINFDMV